MAVHSWYIPLEPGEIVTFLTSWPIADREAEIVEYRGVPGNYIARALGPFSEVWRESSPEGEPMWLPDECIKKRNVTRKEETCPRG